jgi:hypothetical protein
MYNFDNITALGESGTVVKDMSQYANNGIVYSSASRTNNGKRGGAYTFTGSTNRSAINVNDSLSLDGMNKLTLSSRVKFNNV